MIFLLLGNDRCTSSTFYVGSFLRNLRSLSGCSIFVYMFLVVLGPGFVNPYMKHESDSASNACHPADDINPALPRIRRIP